MGRSFKWQDVALAALRAALLAVLTLLGDRLAGQVPSEVIVRGLLAVAPVARHLAAESSLSKSSSLVPFVPANLSLSGRRWHPHHA